MFEARVKVLPVKQWGDLGKPVTHLHWREEEDGSLCCSLGEDYQLRIHDLSTDERQYVYYAIYSGGHWARYYDEDCSEWIKCDGITSSVAQAKIEILRMMLKTLVAFETAVRISLVGLTNPER